MEFSALVWLTLSYICLFFGTVSVMPHCFAAQLQNIFQCMCRKIRLYTVSSPDCYSAHNDPQLYHREQPANTHITVLHLQKRSSLSILALSGTLKILWVIICYLHVLMVNTGLQKIMLVRRIYLVQRDESVPKL